MRPASIDLPDAPSPSVRGPFSDSVPTMSQQVNDIESSKQVGQALTFQIEFAGILEHRKGNKRRIRYEVLINGWPSGAGFYVEGDRTQLSLSDAEIEAARAYIGKFLRDGISSGAEIILREALHLTHSKGEFSDQAFLSDLAAFLKESSAKRLKSDVTKQKRRSWRRFEATAKVHRDMEFFKQFRAEYKRLYRNYIRRTNQRSDQRFVDDVWRQHESRTFSEYSAEYLKVALGVAQAPQGGVTPKEAALEWVGKQLDLAPETLERHYIYRRSKKRTK